MNYRHIYHAGNFADVFKHALLTSILTYQLQKPTPLRYIDTHSGIGLYDLAAPEAERSQEWRTGIGALLHKPAPPVLQEYLAVVGLGLTSGTSLIYPGSPMIAARLLRPTDRLSLAEKHPVDFQHLQANFRGDRRVRIHDIDGYQALNAWTPAKERRGLVLIDPPFEQLNEFDRMIRGVLNAYRKWPQATYLLWYPLKSAKPVESAAKHLIADNVRRLLRLEIMDLKATGGNWNHPGLDACGLFVINPPHSFENQAREILSFLCSAFSQTARWRIDWLVGE